MLSSPGYPVPRWATPRSPDRPSYGADVARIASAFSTPLMPWQRMVADVTTEIVPDPEAPGGMAWAYGVVIVTVQRQAGKTTLFGPVAQHRCLMIPDALTWITAQTGYDARDLWMEVAKRAERSPLASACRIRRANGTESMTWRNGSTFRPFPPVEEAMHGKANQLVGVDEGWAFSDDVGTALEAAISPTFTTTGGQLWIISAGGTAKSSWLLRHVLAGRAAVTAGLRTGTAYFEFGVPEDQVPEVALGLGPEAAPEAFARSIDLVLAAHPAAGYTLRRSALETAARSMKPGEFLRAYANHWTRAGERIIPETLWTAGARDPRSMVQWPTPAVAPALGFAASPDQRDGAIVAAWRDDPGGPLRLDVVDARPGIDWLPARMAELIERSRPAALGHDRAGPALDIASELTLAGHDLISTSTSDYAAACASLLRAVVSGRLLHPGHPDLDNAVAVAARRVIGDGIWAWSRTRSGASIAPLEAATVAAWAFDRRPAAPIAPVIVTARRRVATPDQATRRANRRRSPL